MNTPQLRFKEFNGTFKTYELNKLVTVTDCQHNTAPVSSQPTEYKMIRTSNVRDGKLITSTMDSVNEETYHKWSIRGYLEENDIILTREAPMGEVAMVPKNSNEKFFLGQRCLQLKTNLDVANPFYIYLLLQSKTFEKHIRPIKSSGSTVSNIRIPELKTFEFKVPSKNEQIKVAGFIKNLNKKIQLQQEKIDLLKEQKKGYVQKLFPKNGSLQPELRFYGFSDAWEQQALKEVGVFVRASVDPQATPDAQFVEYSMPSFDNGRLPERVFGKSMQSMRLKISGEVLLINKLNVRQKRIWLVKGAADNAVASNEFMPFTSESINLTFLEQLMLSDNMTRNLESISSGTSNSQKRITPLDLLEYQIKFPRDYDEQKKIGDFLSKIDLKITLIEEKLGALQSQKQAFMQQMFI